METLGNRDLTEKTIAAALELEFEAEGISFERQKSLAVSYRGKRIGEHRLDFLVEGAVIVELKATAALEKIHFSIVRSYLKAAGLQDALLFNFATMPLTIKRVGREQFQESPSPAAVSLH